MINIALFMDLTLMRALRGELRELYLKIRGFKFVELNLRFNILPGPQELLRHQNLHNDQERATKIFW